MAGGVQADQEHFTMIKTTSLEARKRSTFSIIPREGPSANVDDEGSKGQ